MKIRKIDYKPEKTKIEDVVFGDVFRCNNIYYIIPIPCAACEEDQVHMIDLATGGSRLLPFGTLVTVLPNACFDPDPDNG